MRLALALCVLVASCGVFMAPGSYRLYRTSLVPSDPLVLVATFDSPQGEAFNRENCETARQLFQAQPGIVTRFVCHAA